MELLDALILGIIQGLTEFLPVSSSGHLLVGKSFLGYEGKSGLLFEIVVHVGTLLAVVLVYRESLKQYVTGSLQFVKGDGSFAQKWKQQQSVREIFWICVATVPTGLIGILFKKQFESVGVPIVAVMFFVTAFVLLLTRWLSAGERPAADIIWWQALLIGLAQGLAITPGISRSGSTIACALLLGMRRDDAARFSFLLSIPAICGALLLKILKGEFAGVEVMPLLVGGLSAGIVGYFALRWLIKLVKEGQLAWFSLYLVILGGSLLGYHLSG